MATAAPMAWLSVSSSAMQDNRPIGVWAVGCAPAQDPKLTIAVFVEFLPDRAWPSGLVTANEDRAIDDRNLEGADDANGADLERTQRLADTILNALVLDYLRSPANAFN
jgi:hypothetical protein